MQIYLMDGTDNFNPFSTSSTTVGELRSELNAPEASININGVVAEDSIELTANAFVAIVRNNKVGG